MKLLLCWLWNIILNKLNLKLYSLFRMNEYFTLGEVLTREVLKLASASPLYMHCSKSW
jgi:hypothetical protein